MKLTKKLYEYKLNMPADMLKQIGVQKSEEVDIFVRGNGIIVTKKDVEYNSNTKSLEELNSDKVQNPYKNIVQEIKKPYVLVIKTGKRVCLPKAEFDYHKLSSKKYSVLYSYFNGKVNASLILSDKGNFKYGRDNRLTISSLFPQFIIEEGTEIECTINSLGNISFVFDAKNKDNTKVEGFTIHHIVSKKESTLQPIKKEQKDTFKAIIRKRYVITIPSELFNKYELCRAKFNFDITYKADRTILNIIFDNKGKFSFQKTNVLPIKSLFNTSTTLDVDKEVFCTVDKRGMTIEYKEINSNKEKEKEVIDESDDIKEINSNKEKEKEVIDESDDIKEKIYLDKIEEFKRKNIIFKFIDKKDLPKEKICFRCGTNLTNKDNSMYQSHRICNKCKTKKLKELFTPIKELAKIREKRNKND
ncbi:hypothetical protein [uncultured Clostridium sp.]|uniref:AbrB/MazE/SpoVT family DNA-binding domain-containing protein n=1 Tax=uncultured Clostridium sp. TaxID=59620 RepID=UPI0026291168|nr:hypothetical protein [uncultured Clostridium sp.]